MTKQIRVLIVDDLPLVRDVLKSAIEKDPLFQVVGMAADGLEAIEQTQRLKPSVITMDIDMPRMGGLEAIERIMEFCPTPIVVVSGKDARVVTQALGLGAMDFVEMRGDMDWVVGVLVQKLQIASRVQPMRRFKKSILKYPEFMALRQAQPQRIIAIGVSTGGPQALQILLASLPADFGAGIVVVQHISEGFIEGLAEWLSATTGKQVRVAKAQEVLAGGVVYLAPDGHHLRVEAGGRFALVASASKQELHCPSINELMRSVAANVKEQAVGVLMTGMGQDGVDGMRAIKEQGGLTLAQGKNSSVIYGMNKVAVEAGLVDKVVELEGLAGELIRLCPAGKGKKDGI